jgi:hypothetical protein
MGYLDEKNWGFEITKISLGMSAAIIAHLAEIGATA